MTCCTSDRFKYSICGFACWSGILILQHLLWLQLFLWWAYWLAFQLPILTLQSHITCICNAHIISSHQHMQSFSNMCAYCAPLNWLKVFSLKTDSGFAMWVLQMWEYLTKLVQGGYCSYRCPCFSQWLVHQVSGVWEQWCLPAGWELCW